MPVAYLVLWLWQYHTIHADWFTGWYVTVFWPVRFVPSCKKWQQAYACFTWFSSLWLCFRYVFYPGCVWRRPHVVKVICNIFISAPAYGLLQRLWYSFIFKSCMYGSPYFHLFHHLMLVGCFDMVLYTLSRQNLNAQTFVLFLCCALASA